MRWIVRVLWGLILAGALLFGAVLLLPGEKIAALALDQIEAATGRKATISGKAQLRIYPVLGVRAEGLTFANAEWSDRGPMLEAEHLDIGLDAAGLLSGRIQVQTLRAENAVLLLERRADGVGNWEIGGAAGAEGRDFALGLDKAEIAGGTLIYVDHGAKSETRLTDVAGTLAAPDLKGPAQFDLSLSPAGRPVRLEGVIDGLLPFGQGEAVAASAVLSAAGGTAEFAGRASNEGTLEGRLDIALDSTADFTEALGLGRAAPPEGMGRKIKGTVLMALRGGDALALRKLALDLDRNRIEGDADVDFGGVRPTIKGRFRAGDLALSGTDSDAGARQGGGWPTETIDLSALGMVDVQAQFVADSVAFGPVTFGPSDISLGLERARAVFTFNKVSAYGGALNGNFVLNNRGGLSVGGKLGLDGVDVKPLLSDLAGVTRLAGTADGTVEFLGSGSSVDEIVRSLKGSGRIGVAPGSFTGFDLDKLMSAGGGAGEGGTTIFDTASASFTIAGGTMQNDDLKMDLPGYEASGHGRIGLGARDIDYLFVPKSLKARGGRGLAFPVRIRGPWANVKVSVDAGAAIDLNFAEEKKALEDKAKTAVQQKVEEKLDLKVEEGQTLEDAVKKKAEEELLKGLQNLLK